MQLTRLDAVGVQYSYDTADGNLKHVDYTYYRDMHSFTGWIMYREKRPGNTHLYTAEGL